MAPRNTSDSQPIGRLFVIATIRLEQAQSIAIEGQNGRLSLSQQRSVQRRLARAIDRARMSSDRILEALAATPRERI